MIADITITEKSFNQKMLYEALRLSIQVNEKIGLIGRNGAGKSTLLNIMAGTDSDYSGTVQYRKNLIVVATRQEHHGLEKISTVDYILSDLPHYAALKRIIDTYPERMGQNMRLINEYSEALEQFDRLGYYQIEEQIIRELDNFQIDEAKARGSFANLSGGQKRFTEVIKIMYAKAELALIDEPTNHMDYVAKAQFIDWIKQAKMAMLIVTHDRDVLQNMDRIVEIKDKTAVSFPGNYDAYLRQNAVSTTTKMNDYEVVQRQIVNLKAKVLQFRRLKERARDPDTIKQFKRREREAQSELEELQKIEKPSFWIDKDSVARLGYKDEAKYDKYKSRTITLSGSKKPPTANHTKKILELKQVAIGYDDVLFSELNFEVLSGDKLELRGRNGAGKSTLVRAILSTIAGQTPLTLINGEIISAPKLKVGVYEQEVSSTLLDLTLYDAIEKVYNTAKIQINDQKIRQLLSNYLFDPQQDGQLRVSQLSGGQKARLQLISMLANEPQLLILDEPTNHLDLPSIEELEAALLKYDGAIIYVSHDDYFRRHLPTQHVIEIGQR